MKLQSRNEDPCNAALDLVLCRISTGIDGVDAGERGIAATSEGDEDRGAAFAPLRGMQLLVGKG